MATDGLKSVRDARATARSDREIQQQVDKADKKAKPASKKAPQTGQRRYPVAPMPEAAPGEARRRSQARSAADV